MKICVKIKITVKRMASPVLSSSGTGEIEKNVYDDIWGFLTPLRENLTMNAESMVDGDVFDININGSGEASEVCITYHGVQSHFNGFFSKGKECQFTVITSNGRGYTGIFQTIDVNNAMTKDGGRVSIRFKTVLSGVVTSINEMFIDVTPMEFDLRS